jgi:arylsulfatase A-like enzyme
MITSGYLRWARTGAVRSAGLAVLVLLAGLGCGGPDVPSLDIEEGQTALTADGVEVRQAMVGKERRATLSLKDGEIFLSPWVRLPRGTVLELGCGFYRPPFGSGGSPADADELPEPRGRFKARLLSGGGRSARLLDRTVRAGEEDGWIDLETDLSAWAGATVRLELQAGLLDRPAEGAGPILPVWSVPRVMAPAEHRRPEERRLLLLVSLDTLRADAMGVYGSSRQTSPLLDRLAREGVQYSTCLTPSPWTRPSHMSLLTSLYPHVHGLDRNNNLSLSTSFATLAEILEDDHFWTTAITGGGYLYPTHGFERGFQQFHASAGDFARVSGLAGQWIRRWQGLDHFLFLHTYAVHEPYNRQGNYQYHSFGLPNPTQGSLPRKGDPVLPRDSKRLRLLYDDGLLYADHCLGILFERMKQAGLWDRAMIIVVSDHGEMFMEHGEMGHSTRLHEELLQVPLLIKFPRGAEARGAPPPGTVVSEPVELLDVLPTVAAVYGIDTAAAGQFQGRSLLGLEGRGWQYAETHAGDKERRTVRSAEIKYLLNRTDSEEQVFDLSCDPGERRDLAAGGWGGEVYGGRLLLGLAESLGQEGLHLSAAWPANGNGEGRVRGRLEAGSAILSVTANFPREAGRVTILPSGHEVTFDLRPHRVPLDFLVQLEDPGAGLSISFDPGKRRKTPEPTLLLGSGHPVSTLPAASDARYRLHWGKAPGEFSPEPEPGGDGPWIQLYYRAPREEQMPGQAPEERREMLRALGYLE